METLLIRPQDIATVMKRIGLNAFMDKMIAGLTEAFKVAAGGLNEHPPRAGFQTIQPPSVLEWMPYKRQTDQSVAIKVVAYQPKNSEAIGLPTIVANISLYDYTTGHLLAISDGNILTAIRTGAASAVASNILAHPESSTLGLVGAGAQAVTQLHALSRVFALEQVLVYDIDPDASRSLPLRTDFLGLPIRICSLEEVEREADILCTATTVEPGAGPVIRGEALKPHVHINAVGADLPGKIELPLSVLKTSLVCPDFPEQAVVEGECQQLEKSEIGPDLLEVVRRVPEFKSWQQRRTVFDSTGMALEDHLALEIMLKLVESEGLGERIELEYCPTDSQNPYDFICSTLPREADREQIASFS